MASANLDLVRSVYAAWERGDYISAGWAHREIEWVRADGPEPGTWTGVTEMTDRWRDFLDAWEELRTNAEEYRELDDERVLVLDSFSGRGKTSGLEVGETQTKGALLFHLRRGKVVRLVAYWNRERAFADLGLDP
jgi:ketosteroid isomerase-like protein